MASKDDIIADLRSGAGLNCLHAVLCVTGRQGPPSKHFAGYFRFLCPGCGELRATVNPRNNLAHCFCCDQNFNNIDLLIGLGYDFLAAVELLEQWLREHCERHAAPST